MALKLLIIGLMSLFLIGCGPNTNDNYLNIKLRIVAINNNIIGKFLNWENKIRIFERCLISGRIFSP